jgi:hypothetical protein
MALKAHQVDLAHPQEAWICRPVWRVTTVTALGLYRYVLIDEGTLFVDVALDANLVATRHRPYLADGGCAMSVVTIAALDQTFVDPMVKWLRKVCLGGRMASVTELGLRPHQQGLCFLSMMRRVTVEAADVVVGVGGCREMPLLVVRTVATQALCIHLRFRHCLEADDLGDVPSPRHVRRAGTVTGLAAMPVLQSGFEMGSTFELVLVNVFVTGFANVTTDVLCRLVLRWHDVFFLTGGRRWLNPQQ